MEDNTTTPAEPIAPALNDLQIMSVTSTTITLARPTFSEPGNPTPVAEAWIGKTNEISVNDNTISGTIHEGPVNVTNSNYNFSNLDTNTAYSIIVIARNSEGNSIAHLEQTTKPLRITFAAMVSDYVYSLYSVYLDGTGLVKLNTSPIYLTYYNANENQHWSPDWNRVLYHEIREGTSFIDLYVVNSDGTDRTRLNSDFVAGGGIRHSKWAPDNSKVLYSADQETDEVFELYSVNPDGTGLTKISPPMPAGASAIGSFEISPDGTKIAYTLYYPTTPSYSNYSELYCMNIDGSGVVQLDPESLEFKYVYKWSPDGTRIAFTAEDTTLVMELYVVNPDGTGLIKLNGPMVAGGEVIPAEYEWTPDGSKVLYWADQDIDDVLELYSVNRDGTNRVKLNAPLGDGQDVSHFYSCSRDSSRVAYVSNQDNPLIFELYTVRTDGTERTKVNPTLVDGGFIEFPYGWSSDSSKVLYMGQQDTAGLYEVYTVNYDGTNGVKLNTSLPDGSRIGYAQWSPDGTKAYYFSDGPLAEGIDDYIGCANADGTDHIQIQHPDIGLPQWSPDSSTLIYIASDSGPKNLYAASYDGTTEIMLNEALDPEFHPVNFCVPEKP